MTGEDLSERDLLREVRKASDSKRFFQRFKGLLLQNFRNLHTSIPPYRLGETLSPYTNGVKEHLRNLSISDKFDPIISSKEWQYHLYMLEIELTNRVNVDAFRNSPYRMALIAHCLRDFRDGCQARPGDIEAVCAHCDQQCHIHLGTLLLEEYGIKSYISVNMDHDSLFKGLKSRNPQMGALGIACVPELVMGMRLCEKLDIPAVGVPLDANRCIRWFDECLESSFSLVELGNLL